MEGLNQQFEFVRENEFYYSATSSSVLLLTNFLIFHLLVRMSNSVYIFLHVVQAVR